MGSEMLKNWTSENHRELIGWASKVLHEWSVHLEIFSCPQVLNIEKILGNICFSEQIFYRKQSLGAPGVYTPFIQSYTTSKDLNLL